MNIIVNFLVPQSWWDGILRWNLLVFSVYAWHVVVYHALLVPLGISPNQRVELFQTYLVGGPFALLALGVALRQNKLRQRLIALATTDVLTGLRNRGAFWKDATELQEYGGNGLLMVLDADHFKQINDTYGHAAGDLCLQEIAAKLREVTRKSDIVGRLGGEEFGVYLPDASVREAERIAARICAGVTVRLKNDSKRLTVTLSGGATRVPCRSCFDEAFRHADAALYRAKAAGRARMVWSSFTTCAAPA